MNRAWIATALLWASVGSAATAVKPLGWSESTTGIVGYGQRNGEWKRPVFVLRFGSVGLTDAFDSRYIPAARVQADLRAGQYDYLAFTLTNNGTEYTRRVWSPARWAIVDAMAATGSVRFKCRTDDGLGECGPVTVPAGGSVLVPVTPNTADWIRFFLRGTRNGMVVRIFWGD